MYIIEKYATLAGLTRYSTSTISLAKGVNSRAELLPSPLAYARNGAARRWLGD
jgi:hypothetical protein